MKIAIGADHAGFSLKERVRGILSDKGHTVVDLGTNSSDSADYPDFAESVSRAVVSGDADFGILVCSTGAGMSIAANKIDGVRSAVGVNAEEVSLTRAHNDANILALGAKYIDEARAEELVDIFLNTPFDGGRHARRVAKIVALERAEDEKGTE